MKLAISNLCWDSKYDDIMFMYLREHHISLEVAPDRIFKWEESKVSNRSVSPYERFTEAEAWYHIVNTHYRIDIASMQSVLYRIDENMFLNRTYRRYLQDYLQKAVNFAVMLKCPNMSFECAGNRNIPANMDALSAGKIAEEFFTELADYALKSGVCISIEPMPQSRGTNFINYTYQAFDLVRKINRPDFKVNVDLGTIIENGEDINEVFSPENMPLINHVHISEPGLAPIQDRPIYKQTAKLLHKRNYKKYVSVEMLRYPDVKLIQAVMNYFSTIFC